MDFKIEIAKLLAAAAEISVEDAAAAVEIPAKKEMGDFAYPCFRLAKVFRKAPPMIAAELIEKIRKACVYRKDAGGRCIYQFFCGQECIRGAGAFCRSGAEGKLWQERHGRRQNRCDRLFLSQYCKALPCWASAFYCNRQRDL